MILLVWAIFFMIALIPGGITGWLIGKLPIAIGWTILLSVIASCLIGFVVEIIMSTDSTATTKRHFENILMFAPPIAMAMFLGIFLAVPRKTLVLLRLIPNTGVTERLREILLAFRSY